MCLGKRSHDGLGWAALLSSLLVIGNLDGGRLVTSRLGGSSDLGGIGLGLLNIGKSRFVARLGGCYSLGCSIDFRLLLGNVSLGCDKLLLGGSHVGFSLLESLGALSLEGGKVSFLGSFNRRLGGDHSRGGGLGRSGCISLRRLLFAQRVAGSVIIAENLADLKGLGFLLGSRNGRISRIERGARSGSLLVVTLNLLDKRRLASLGGVLSISYGLCRGLVDCIGLGYLSVGDSQRLVGSSLGCRGVSKCLGGDSDLGLCGFLLSGNQFVERALGGCGGLFLVLVLGVSLSGLVSSGKGAGCLFHFSSCGSQHLISSSLHGRDIGNSLGSGGDLGL